MKDCNCKHDKNEEDAATVHNQDRTDRVGASGYTAAVITVSDKAARGEREDTSGPAVSRILSENGWNVIYESIVPDDADRICKELTDCADKLGAALILTSGGTGFSPRDVTPEATMAVVERVVPGIPEAMRAASMKITPHGCLSRVVAGIRKVSLIVNLPGSEKAARENLMSVIRPIRHGVDMLRSDGSADCGAPTARIIAVCISEKKGEQKHAVDEVSLVVEHGIEGDAHAGKWHRQVSLLGEESVAKLQERIDFKLKPGDFAENILTRGLVLYELPVGTRLMVGSALCEVTQIGKACHEDCAIRKAAGDCVMPREGIFVKVLKDGKARAGDSVRIVSRPTEHTSLF